MHDFEYDVFLSHNSKDKSEVRVLAEQLQRDGVKVWFDEWRIEPGDSIPIAIGKGLTGSRVLVLCMSENFFASDWAAFEHSTALFRDPINRQRRFIPLLLSGCEIPEPLKQFLYLDWRTKDKNTYERLLKICR